MSSSDEYNALRAEILHEYQREVNLSTLAFTATAIIIGYGFTAPHPRPIVFLVPLLLLTLLLFQLVNSCRTILTISVYIRSHIEKRNRYVQQRWETAVSMLRRKLQHEERFHPLTELIFAIFTALTGAICILLFLVFTTLYPTGWFEYVALAIAVVAWPIICIVSLLDLIKANHGSFERKVRGHFKNIHRRLNSKRERTVKRLKRK
jgi:hypothetical protein